MRIINRGADFGLAQSEHTLFRALLEKLKSTPQHKNNKIHKRFVGMDHGFPLNPRLDSDLRAKIFCRNLYSK